MFSKTIIAATIAALFATNVAGASLARAAAGVPIPRAIAIAPNAHAACNCPDNCQHNNGDSCAFYSNGNVLNGECQHADNDFKCVA